jgi:hypothetical protein
MEIAKEMEMEMGMEMEMLREMEMEGGRCRDWETEIAERMETER